MFYVFGIHGPMYQGGPDRLSQIAAVRGVQRPSGLRASSSGIESQEAQARNPDLLHHLTARAQGAVSAYLGTEQGPKEERKRLYLVRDVMTRGAVTVTPELTVEQAWQVLASKKIAQARCWMPSSAWWACCCARTWPPWRCCPSPAHCAMRSPWPSAR